MRLDFKLLGKRRSSGIPYEKSGYYGSISRVSKR